MKPGRFRAAYNSVVEAVKQDENIDGPLLNFFARSDKIGSKGFK
jgi:hypothetical protein